MFVREADEAVDLGAGDVRRRRATASARAATSTTGGSSRRWWRRAPTRPGWAGASSPSTPTFAELCQRLGIVFIGPNRRRHALARRQDRREAPRRARRRPGGAVERRPGRDARRRAATGASASAIRSLIKATAGGGGRGIRTRAVRRTSSTRPSSGAARKPLRAFGDATVFLERLLAGARHVEVQIIADHYGTTWAVGVRDCTIQRRHQKVLEEAPSPVLSAEQDQALARRGGAPLPGGGLSERRHGRVPLRSRQPRVLLHGGQHAPAGRAPGDRDDHRARSGEAAAPRRARAAGWRASRPRPRGHAIEVRLNAEDPDNDFAPAPGVIELFRLPTGPGTARRHRRRGGRCGPAGVRLDDRQDHRLRARPRARRSPACGARSPTASS